MSQEFEKFLSLHLGDYPTNTKGLKKFVHTMYFENPQGCVPSKYLSEDLLSDIHTRFYYPLSFIRSLFIALHPELSDDILLITIDPSYENTTNFNLTLLNRRILLLEQKRKSWLFWFKNEVEFEDWIQDCLKEMEDGIKSVNS